MNIFYEDSTLRIDADKSAYGIDAAKEVDVYAYELSRDESGKLVFDRKAVCLQGKVLLAVALLALLKLCQSALKASQVKRNIRRHNLPSYIIAKVMMENFRQ